MGLASPAYGRCRNPGLIPDERSGTYVTYTGPVVIETQGHVLTFATNWRRSHNATIGNYTEIIVQEFGVVNHYHLI